MAVSADDVNAVRALWEEWTAGSGFVLSIEVLIPPITASILPLERLAARISADSRFVAVQIRHRSGRLVFDQQLPNDPAALRASVSVLARTIAQAEALEEAMAAGEDDDD